MSEESRRSIEAAEQSQTTLGGLARLFLKLGAIAFRGPAAHIAIMEEEVVRAPIPFSPSFADVLRKRAYKAIKGTAESLRNRAKILRRNYRGRDILDELVLRADLK